uniref:Protein Ycf2-like n=1 Tax=Cucumis melo TaxID=3656 RepID=A0A9I9EFN9_CUCME
MIDDEETLINFPWGRLSSNLTVEYMRKAAEDLTVNFSLQGFPHILVCWALEIIPKLSKSPNGIATRIEHRSPRIINWKLEQQPVWTYLQWNYFKSSDFTVIPFTPTSDELISPNFQFFLNDAPNEVEKERSEETEDENDKGDEEETVNDETKKSLRKEIQEVKKDLESLKNTVENGKNEATQNRVLTRKASQLAASDEK